MTQILFFELSDMFEDKLNIVNGELLHKHLDKGRGLIILSSHYGPSINIFPLRNMDFESKIVGSDDSFNYFNRARKEVLPFLQTGKNAFYIDDDRMFTAGKDEKKMVRFLEKGGLLSIAIDIPTEAKSAREAPFFNRTLKLSTFPFKLSKKRNIPVLIYFFGYNQKEGLNLTFMEVESGLTPGESLERYVNALEERIRENPFMWASAYKFY